MGVQDEINKEIGKPTILHVLIIWLICLYYENQISPCMELEPKLEFYM